MTAREETRSFVEDWLMRQRNLYSVKTPNQFPLRDVQDEADLPVELGRWSKMLNASNALEDERAREFASTMSEVLTNSFSHGRSSCMVAGQTFTKGGHSVLAAVDGGRSIPQTLVESGRYPGERSDEGWILYALQRGVTCKSRPTNQGYGLYVLTQMIQKNGGSMLLVSRNGLVHVEPQEIKPQPLGVQYGSFTGTFLLLDIKMRAA